MYDYSVDNDYEAEMNLRFIDDASVLEELEKDIKILIENKYPNVKMEGE